MTLNRSRRPGQRLAFSRVAVFAVAAIAFGAGTVVAMMLYENIRTRKEESRHTAVRIAAIDETTIDPAEWGKNFPRQYDGYKRTADNAKARFRWSDGRPPEDALHTGAGESKADEGKAESKLESNPRLKTMFKGYAFAIDYRERRGHAFMLDDQRDTERVKQRPQPGACLNCHASNVVAYREAGLEHGAAGALSDPLHSETGLEQLFAGWEHVNQLSYADATALVSHPVTCLDCHDPDSMRLRITRPAFMEGIAALAASNEPLPHLPSIEKWRRGNRATPYDANELAGRQEMRSLSCAQCHVEYYFKGDQKRLTFPWLRGLKMEQMEAYYDEVDWADWTHADSGTRVLKAQHPEFELWSQGIHARSGVSCADCHMPYVREGAIKVSNHHVRSPLLNVAQACQTCHRVPEKEITARALLVQDRNVALLNRGEQAMVGLMDAISAAQKAGATDAQLLAARLLHRKAQWRLDFISAENSMGFHAPQEAARILAEAIDYARQGELAVARDTKPGAAGNTALK